MWKDSYSIGVELIDNQHKELFRISESLLVSMKQVQAATDYKKNIGESINFFKGYAIQHFNAEEGYLSNIGYKDLEAHKKLHVALGQHLLNYERQLNESNYSLPVIRNFLGFIVTWLIHHVAGEDQKFPGAKNAIVTSAESSLASKIIEVFKTMTGIDENSIRVSQSSQLPSGSNICFRLGLVGNTNKALGFAFSEQLAVGVFKIMTGMDMDMVGQNELIVSALSELSNIMGGRIASTAAPGVIPIDIETPVITAGIGFPAQREGISLNTTIGDMSVFIFNKT